MIVFGTRPEAIKMAPLCLAFREESAIQSIVCVTGQHREMLDQVLHLFGITPDIDLNIMKKGQDLFDVTEKILQGKRLSININLILFWFMEIQQQRLPLLWQPFIQILRLGMLKQG